MQFLQISSKIHFFAHEVTMKRLFASFTVSAVFFSLLVLIASCATIVNGQHDSVGRQNVTVISSPSDAAISIDGITGVGRVQLSVARGEEHLIEVKKDGYKAVHISTASGTVGSYFGNIALLPFGIIGELVDLATGAVYSVKPGEVIVALEKGDGIDERVIPDTAAPGILLGMLASVAILVLCLVIFI